MYLFLICVSSMTVNSFLFVATYRFAADLLSRGQDAHGLVNVQDAISVQIHGVEEGMQHFVRNLAAMFTAVIALLFKFIGKLSQTIEVDAALVKHSLDDPSSVAKEVLERAVLLGIADAHFVVLVLVEVEQVVRNLVEWNVVNVQTLRNVESSDVIMLVLLELVELEVPEGLNQLVSEIHILFVSDLILTFEDSLAHSNVDLREITLLTDCLELLGEIRLGLVATDRLGELAQCHLAAGLVEVLDDALFRRLAQQHEEVELGKRNLSVSVHIGNFHDLVDLSLELIEVIGVVLRLLVVVGSEGLKEVLVRHGLLAIFVQLRGELLVDLLRRAKEPNLVFFVASQVVIIFGRLSGEGQIRLIQIKVRSDSGRQHDEMSSIESFALSLLPLMAILLVLEWHDGLLCLSCWHSDLGEGSRGAWPGAPSLFQEFAKHFESCRKVGLKVEIDNIDYLTPFKLIQEYIQLSEQYLTRKF